MASSDAPGGKVVSHRPHGRMRGGSNLIVVVARFRLHRVRNLGLSGCELSRRSVSLAALLA